MQQTHGNYNYGYDKAYRLKSATSPTLDNESYSYDKVGNRLSSANTTGNWNYDNSDQLLSTPTDTYEYTVNGNTKKIPPSDTTQKVTDYIYDSRERLTEVKKDNTTIQNSRYDFQQRRVVKTTVSGTTYFLYGQSGLIAEYEIDGDFIQGYGYFPKASYTTNPIYTITPKTGTGYAFDFYHNDHLATPQKLTNSTGAVSWAMQSNAFGEVTIKTQTTKNNLRFPGQYYDTEIKLSQNYYRDYAPNLGRYVQSDPIGLLGGINTFGYVLQNPIRLLDPMGLNPFGGDTNNEMSCAMSYECQQRRLEARASASRKKNCFDIKCTVFCAVEAFFIIDFNAKKKDIAKESIGNYGQAIAKGQLQQKASIYANAAVDYYDQTGKLLGKKVSRFVVKAIPIAGHAISAYQTYKCVTEKCVGK